MIEGALFRRERMAEAASDEMLAATDVADLLVKRGMPFRQAHEVPAANHHRGMRPPVVWALPLAPALCFELMWLSLAGQLMKAAIESHALSFPLV